MRTALVLFTRDLRVHDHRGLSDAARAHERIVPLFVLDDRLLDSRAPNRIAFLLEALADLRRSLRERGADLIVRRGDPVRETLRLARAGGCESIFVSQDASPYAHARAARLVRACERARLQLRIVSTCAVVAPGQLAPDAGDHYRVFTPYWRRWRHSPPRVARAPARVQLPAGVAGGELPSLGELTTLAPSADRAVGGEREGRRRLARWLSNGLSRYEAEGSQLAADATSRLSPYLHFGCVSAAEVVVRAARRPNSESFVRQVCWRDFFLQLLAANPETTREDLRSRRGTWRDDDEALARWRKGRTGHPIVDAGMRQLAREGWLPNRARLIVGSFLTRSLGLDWRLGAKVFSELLVDCDVASNVGNWQWVAGTGANPRPGRALQPSRQAARFDPAGDYVRRYVPELAQLPGRSAHEPWKAPRSLVAPEYPEPLLL